MKLFPTLPRQGLLQPWNPQQQLHRNRHLQNLFTQKDIDNTTRIERNLSRMPPEEQRR